MCTLHFLALVAVYRRLTGLMHSGLRIKESKEVYEGEVTELSPAEGAAQGSEGKVVKHVVISMRTSKGSKTLKLDPSIQDGLLREKVNVGDVIYIEANSGAVKRVGRCDTHAAEYDLEADEYVPMPKVCSFIHPYLHGDHLLLCPYH